MKIRTNYVSNSSSSSYLIECGTQKDVDRVLDCFNKLIEYYNYINPHYIGYGLECVYQQVDLEQIKQHFDDYCMDKKQQKYNLIDIEKEIDKGYIYLLGNESSEDGTPIHDITYNFNENVLPYILHENSDELFANLVFECRWS